MGRRIRKVVLWVIGLLVIAPVLAIAAVLVLLNTGPGRRLAERQAGALSGGTVRIDGLSGRFPDALRLRHLEVRDGAGAWLIGDGIALDWSPVQLAARTARVQSLTVERLQLPRLPASAPAPGPAGPTSPFTLPVRVIAERVHVDRAEIGAPVAGEAAALSVDLHGDAASLDTADIALALKRLDGEGEYGLAAKLDPERLTVSLTAAEPAHGFLGVLATLPDLGPLHIAAHLDGPRSAAAVQASVTAGPLRADAHGAIDLDHQAADLDLAASAPAMAPRPDIAWRSVAIDAHVHGPFTRPDASGQVRIAGLRGAGSSLDQLTADISGNAGRVGLRATLDGLRLAGPAPDLLAADPVQITGDVRLDEAARPVTFSLTHKLLAIDGTARTGGSVAADINLGLPSLAPFAAIAGVDVQGSTRLKLHAGQDGPAMQFALDGALGITGGLAPLPALIGPNGAVAVRASLAGQDIAIERASLDGRTLHASVAGTDRGGALDLNYNVEVSDLGALASAVAGALQAQGTVKGPPDDLAVAADLRGTVAAGGQPPGPVGASVRVQGLPGKPQGRVEAQGTLAGAPLALAVQATRTADGAVQATIERADWRSAHAEGGVRLAPGAAVPTGRVSLRMTRLDDLQPFVHQVLSGAVTAEAELSDGAARLTLEARDAGAAGSRIGRATLNATVAAPATAPVVEAKLALEGIEAAGVAGAAQLEARGPQSALALKLGAQLRVQNEAVAASAAALLDAPSSRMDISALQATARGETMRLLAPARLAYGGPVTVDRLRLGLRQAVLEVAGRVSPTLDVAATLRNVSADLAKLVAPDLAADGVLNAEAHITGTPAAPAGTAKLTAAGLHLRAGPAQSLPPANLTANLQLHGQSARLDARFDAGNRVNLVLNGTAPLGAGALDLHAAGRVDLAVTDPILTPDGRRARGRLSLDASVTGTTAAPRLGGTVQLAGGEVQDFGQGVRIDSIAATLRAEGEAVRIVSLTGRAGPGTLAVSGSVGALAPGLPVDLSITLRHARPLASDRLTADVDADLTVKGQAAALSAAGRVSITHAEINIPQHLPASVAVLDVRRPGQRPPAPAAPTAGITLDLTVDAAQVFVRGRGLDSQLAGNLRIRGSSTRPQVAGGFDMVRGTISLAGTTLDFARGKVGFDGVGVTGTIDPTLDFEADSVTSSITAKLLVGGYASAPKITLTSTPELPQDEVLAYLIFKRSAKDLGPFQIASIAASVAELSGVTGGASNPLDRVRTGLGLDRLSVGGGSGNSATPSLEAGRYVANGVYVGAKQGTSGAGTQATVQIDITKGLKVETDVGAGQGGNSVGLTYQYEY